MMQQPAFETTLESRWSRAPLVILLLMFPALGGCLHQWGVDKKTSASEAAIAELVETSELEAARETALKYYDRTGRSADHYSQKVTVDVPKMTPPLTALNPEASEKWFLTLEEAIRIGVKRMTFLRQLSGDGSTTTSNGITAQDLSVYDVAVAEARVESEIGRLFDPTWSSGLFWGRTRQQINSNVAQGQTVIPGFPFKQDLFGQIAAQSSGIPGTSPDLFSVQKRFATGAQASVSYNSDYDLPNITSNRFLNSAWNSNLTFTFVQPLLQSAGTTVVRAPIVVARLNADQAVWDIRDQFGRYVRDVEESYWRLFQARIDIEAIDAALKVSHEILRVADVIERKGRGTPGDRIEAEAQNVRLRSARLDALNQLLQRESDLRALIGEPPSDGRRIVPVDEPSMAPVVFDWQQIVSEAITFHPQMQQAKIEVQREMQQLLRAKNFRLPQLDLMLSRQFFGLGDRIHDSINQLSDGDFGSWTIGVQMQGSFGNRQAENAILSARYNIAKAIELVRERGHETVLRLQSVYAREVVPAQAEYDLSRTQRKLAQDLLDARLIQYQRGSGQQQQASITIDRLLQAVEGVTRAMVDETRVLVEYSIALASLELAKGTILEYNSIHVHEGPWASGAYPQARRHAVEERNGIPYNHGPLPTEPIQKRTRDIVDKVHNIARKFKPGDGTRAGHRVPVSDIGVSNGSGPTALESVPAAIESDERSLRPVPDADSPSPPADAPATPTSGSAGLFMLQNSQPQEAQLYLNRKPTSLK